MMERGGDLDQALQECFFGCGRLQPDLFPGFVGVEEVAPVELLDAPQEFFVSALQFHLEAAPAGRRLAS
jgi:hypothetical protein